MVYRRRSRARFTWWQTLLLLGAVVVIFSIAQGLNTPVNNVAVDLDAGTPTLPNRLTRADALPTLTPNAPVALRQVILPAAPFAATIVEAWRVGDSWEMRHLGDSVGHLAGTSWLDDSGGNIVLAGHIENAQGQPGPFAHLSEVKAGDLLVLREGQRLSNYRVVTVARAAPNDMQYVIQDGHRRLTLLTCSDWDANTASYLSRLVVVAVLSK